jgi:ribose transport system ATP-binding protein
MTEAPPAVDAQHISKTFPGQLALDDVSMVVKPGTVHALVGQNGSGKSTLIKVLDGYHVPDPGGTVYLNGTLIGRDRAAAAHRLGLRCVHQDLGLIDEFNIVENFGLTDGYPMKLGRVDWGAIERRVGELMERIDVEVDLAKPLGVCAPVERTAAAVIRAVADFDLGGEEGGCLLLDEPTAALSGAEVDRLFDIVLQLKRHGVAVIYVSHRLDEIFAIADEVTTLREGRVVRSGEIGGLSRKQLIEDITGYVTPTDEAPRARRTTPNSEAVLAVHDLAGQELRGVSFSVSRGEILGVAGLLGSGRGELPYLVTGHQVPASGSVEVADPRPSGRSAKKGNRIALVPSERLAKAAIAQLSVRENMTLGNLAAFGRVLFPRSKERRFVQHWEEAFDIRPRDSERKFDTLSGGNQQKVVLAKWIGTDPEVLVVDEPTAGVDVGAREKIYGLLRQQASEGLSIIALSSDLDELSQIADRVLVLRNGLIVDELADAEITSNRIIQQMNEGG